MTQTQTQTRLHSLVDHRWRCSYPSLREICGRKECGDVDGSVILVVVVAVYKSRDYVGRISALELEFNRNGQDFGAASV